MHKNAYIYGMTILNFDPLENSIPAPPPHPHYVPTDAFVARHSLFVEEDERWVSLADTEDLLKQKRTLAFNKKYGQIALSKYIEICGQRCEQVVFCGFLPDEVTLEAIIKYTNWYCPPVPGPFNT